jgi:hypothetical protein
LLILPFLLPLLLLLLLLLLILLLLLLLLILLLLLLVSDTEGNQAGELSQHKIVQSLDLHR